MSSIILRQLVKSFAFFLFTLAALPSLSVLGEEPNEHMFISLYGKERIESGRWRRVRFFRNDTEKMENISAQAHRNAGLGCDDLIHSAVFDTRHLNFVTREFFDARLRVDTIIYSVNRAPKKYYYIIKGLSLGCVHYLRQTDKYGFVFELGEHVCGIQMPILEPMLSFLQRS